MSDDDAWGCPGCGWVGKHAFGCSSDPTVFHAPQSHHKDSGPAGDSGEATTEHPDPLSAAVIKGAAGPRDRQPSRIPPEALAAVERLLAASAVRLGEPPGVELWASKSVTHHVQKGVGHGMEYQVGIRSDAETGESPALHAFARFMFAVALEERARGSK